MKAKTITSFVSQFSVDITLNPDLIVEGNGRFYLVNVSLKPFLRRDFFYAGIILGKAKGGKFFPSFNLLSMIAKKDANRIVINQKASWLFICGRSILAKSVLRVFGACKKNSHVLVLNEFNECLGFGKIVGNLRASDKPDEMAVSNVSDVGDFLRRER